MGLMVESDVVIWELMLVIVVRSCSRSGKALRKGGAMLSDSGLRRDCD